MSNASVINFYGQRLAVIKQDDVPYVALKPIVESLGLDWKVQHRKTAEDTRFNCGHITIVARDGKERQVACIPLKKLNAFLFSINPNKVRADLREMLEHYQEECAAALYNYWTFGYALNPRLVTPAQQSLFIHVQEKHGELPSAIPVTDAWKWMIYSQVAGAPSRNVLLGMVKRGTLKGHKTDFGWVIERDSFNGFIRRLKLQM